jgi:signal transduction histidine kinase
MSALLSELAPVSASDTSFRALLDILPAAAYTCDRHGRITYFNRQAVALWGRTPRLDDRDDLYCGSYRLFSPAGAPIAHADCWMALALREGRDFDGREIMVERPDGTRRVALAHASPLRDADGSVRGGVNVLVDITCQKEAEARQLEANHRKDVFLATLAHELRNPLAPIRCAVPILRKTCASPDAAPVLAMVERQVDHLVRLVDDLLDASRMTRGKLRLRKQRIDIASVIAIATETSRPRIDAGRHTLRVRALEAPAWIDADPVRLAQVVSNLIDNAAKFTPPGGTIEVVVKRDGPMLDIRVRDDGAGIPADALPHVFELFMQEERWLEGMQAGLGVGLALARNLVELHGGTVCAHSDGEGKGSEFTVRMPLADAPPVHTGTAAERSDTVTLVQQRVLIVDDNHDAAQSLAILVELLGHTAHVSFDGDAALAAAAQCQPSVALLDLSMPGMSGFEVARRLRAQAGSAKLRLIALSGRSEEQYRRQSEAAGFDAHLVKPIDLRTLEAVLRGARMS